MHVLLIHNPGSGGEDHDRDALVARLELVGHDVEYRSTEESEWIDALSAKPDLFAVAGGDGTVNRVFKELAGSSTPVTVIPLGTANNIAGTLGLAGASAEELIAAWPDFVLRPFDVGEASAQWGTRQFVETAGCGLARRALPVRRRAGRARGQGAARARVAPRCARGRASRSMATRARRRRSVRRAHRRRGDEHSRGRAGARARTVGGSRRRAARRRPDRRRASRRAARIRRGPARRHARSAAGR